MAEKKPPLLSDEEMARLNEEIFGEPVSIEILFRMYDDHLRSRAPNEQRRSEWVMDRGMLNRIRRLVAPSGLPFVEPSPDLEMQLIGLPVAVEPLAKLDLRVRHG